MKSNPTDAKTPSSLWERRKKTHEELPEVLAKISVKPRHIGKCAKMVELTTPRATLPMATTPPTQERQYKERSHHERAAYPFAAAVNLFSLFPASPDSSQEADDQADAFSTPASVVESATPDSPASTGMTIDRA